MDRFEEIHEHNNSRKLNILKGFVEVEDIIEKAKNRQVGEVHSSGKYVWTALPNGKFDWRANKGAKQETSESKEEADPDRPYKNMSKEDLHKLVDKKAGRDRANAVKELAKRYEEKTGKPATVGALDRKDPKIDNTRVPKKDNYDSMSFDDLLGKFKGNEKFDIPGWSSYQNALNAYKSSDDGDNSAIGKQYRAKMRRELSSAEDDFKPKIIKYLRDKK